MARTEIPPSTLSASVVKKSIAFCLISAQNVLFSINIISDLKCFMKLAHASALSTDGYKFITFAARA